MNIATSSAEAELLLASIDVSITLAERRAVILGLIRKGLDWNRLNRMIVTHRLTPLVYPNLSSKPISDGVPFEALLALRVHYLSCAYHTVRIANEAVRLMGLLEGGGIPALILKGPALSLMAYGGVSMREYGDLDLLVHRDDLVAAAELLISAGYSPRTWDREAFESGFFGNTSDDFATAGGKSVVDLHWGILTWYFPFGPDEGGLWSRGETIHIEGNELRMPAATDHLLFLCAHASKHGWHDLASVADIAALMQARPEIDLGALIDEATRLHSRRMLLLGLYLAHRLAHAALPDTVLRILKGDSSVIALGEQICTRMLAGAELPGKLARLRTTIKTIERRSDRLRFVLSLGLQPTTGDCAMVRFPRALYPLYYLVRPFRVVRKGHAMLGHARGAPHPPRADVTADAEL
jgi:hypothetical protein